MTFKFVFDLLKRLAFLPLILLLVNCTEEPKINADIEKVAVDLEVIRFDREFAEASLQDLPALKFKYPYLFPEQYQDSIWELKMQDSLQRALLKEIDATFGDFSEQQKDLELLFKHLVYYFPRIPVPKIITVSSDVDYVNRIILADTLVLIGLDNYLGKDHRFYSRIDRYIAAGLEKEYLISDVAGTYAKKVINFGRDRTFLGQMISYGKELYFKDMLLPLASDEEKIGYTSEQLQWARANEEQIWRYFIERELLYSTDRKLGPRFLDPAPFSKFRLELDNESPGRLGRYVGWQIVRAFADNNKIPFQELLALPAEEIFKRSNYKPKK